MGSNKKTHKKKIRTLCVVAACSQLIKHNRKHSRVSRTKKKEMWGKPWLAEKHRICMMD